MRVPGANSPRTPMKFQHRQFLHLAAMKGAAFFATPTTISSTRSTGSSGMSRRAIRRASPCVRHSFRLDAGLSDDDAPAAAFLVHKCSEIGGRAAGDIGPLIDEPSTDIGHL